MPTLDPPTIALSIRALVALIFLTAALGKLRHPAAFEGVLDNYRILPQWTLTPVRYGLPLLELALVPALLLLPRIASPIAAVLLCLFGIAMAVNLRRGRNHIDCGCHQSAMRQKLRWPLVWRNGVLGGLALLAAIPREQPGPQAVAFALLAGLSLFLLYLTLNALWALGPVPPRSRIQLVVRGGAV